MLTNEEMNLYKELSEFDSLDTVQGVQQGVSKGIGASVLPVKGNLPFRAQFSLNVKTYYYDTSLGQIPPSSLDSSLKNKIPLILFGNADEAGKFKNLKKYYNSFWDSYSVSIKEKSSGIFYSNDDGDLVIAGSKNLGGTPTVIQNFATVIHCDQVAYGTLLAGLVSDVFRLNMIRIVVPSGYESQLNNSLQIIRQTMFGKISTDSITPSTYVTGETYNKNIADIPLNVLVDKYLGIYQDINYDCTNMDIIFTVESFKRLQ